VTPTRTRLSREERRELLLDTAARLVLEQGIDAVTMEGVALAAGASKTLGYAYFANRSDLLTALLEREVADLDRRSATRLAAAESYEDVLRAAVGAWFDLVDERGPLLGALLQAADAKDEIAARQAAFTAEQEQVYGAFVAAAFGIDRDVATAATAILFAGLGSALVRWAEGDLPRAVYEETYVQIVLAAVERLAGDDAAARRPPHLPG
jgi:AcrR family transcriptional regulator